VIGVPFHLGVKAVGMGKGALELLGDGAIPDRLRQAGYDVETMQVGDPVETHEVGRIFELNRTLAGVIAAAVGSDRLPAVVSGNCNVCLGAIGGIGARDVGIVWLDAHPDFQTPETTDSGFIDGMGLAAATGACWSTLCQSIPGLRPVAERNTLLVGVRDIDPGEQERLDAGEVAVVKGGEGPGRLAIPEVEGAVAAMADRVDGVYLHVDFDAIDPCLGRANEYAAGGGLGIDDVEAVVRAVARHTPVLAVSFTAYDPEVDPDHRFGATALRSWTGSSIHACVEPPRGSTDRQASAWAGRRSSREGEVRGTAACPPKPRSRCAS
jgi:arginase